MATVTINNWTITAINPDGTDNSLLPVITGGNPNNEIIEHAAMGMRFRIELDCQITGTYSDTSTADLAGTIVRYNPAMFVPVFTFFTPIGAFPSGGYTAQVTNTPETKSMDLSFKNGEFAPSNINGDVEIQVVDSDNFVIRHLFRMTSDIENYLIGDNISNQFRLTKSSTFNAEELNSVRESVYGYEKSLNILVATRQRNFDTVVQQELRIGFRASFNNLDNRLIPMFDQSFVANRPIGQVTSISSFDDTQMLIEWQDPSALIVLEEAVVIITERKNESNISTFVRDLRISETKLVTTVGTGSLSPSIKGPVTYDQSSGVTSVLFTIDKDYIQRGYQYDVHIYFPYQSGPSSLLVMHAVLSLSGQSESPQFPMDAESNWYSRNNHSGNNFEATVMERITNRLLIDFESFNLALVSPFTVFHNDISYIAAVIRDAQGTVIYTAITPKIAAFPAPLFETDNGQITVVFNEPADEYEFWLNEIRLGYENEQGLLDMADETFELTWYIRLIASEDDRYELEYQIKSTLDVRNYENYPEIPSGFVPKVRNIRFLNPETGLPIANWCDATDILVVADVDELTDTKVTVFVDRFPLGATFQNDYQLQEENLNDSLVTVITDQDSEMVSELQYDTGVVSFRLDISELSGDEKMRISIQIYQQ